MSSLNIVCADVLDWCESYSGPPFHALLADAPYQYGFMNRSWDSTGITYQPETWAALAKHLHPGAFLMVFGGARSWHRLAVAMEDAGLILHPTIYFYWVNGQGFPKATRIDTQIDRRKGFKPGLTVEITRYLNEARKKKGITIEAACKEFGMATMAGHWFAITEAGQPVIPRLEYWPKLKDLLNLDDRFDEAIEAHEREIVGKQIKGSSPLPGNHWGSWADEQEDGEFDITAPATDLARTWQGHRYGLQALKPAVEPIIVAQKPYAGRPVDCIVETGAGALWIDGGRVATGDNLNGGSYSEGGKANPLPGDSREGAALGMFQPGAKPDHPFRQPSGRWPPNFALVHMPPTLRCTQCQAVHPIQPVIEVCPDCGGELERVEGCRRVGVKRVRGVSGGGGLKTSDKNTVNCYGEYADRELPDIIGYADPDGREAVADFRCADGCPARRLGAMSGSSQSPLKSKHKETGTDFGIINDDSWQPKGCDIQGYADKGTAARFYPQADWQHEVAEQLAQADPVRYVPKAAKRERNSGLDDFYWRRDKTSPTGFVRVSQEEWEALPKRQRARGNIHPTQKPIALTKWLATLLLPPPEYAPRRIMVPFGGKMSEAIGALLAGWEEIVAIEMHQDYCDAGEARAALWSTRQLELPAARPARPAAGTTRRTDITTYQEIRDDVRGTERENPASDKSSQHVLGEP